MPHLPERDNIHYVLWCVKCDPDISPLLQLNTAIQTGGAPQLRDPVHCSLTQSTINPHPGRQPHVGTENKGTSYTLFCLHSKVKVAAPVTCGNMEVPGFDVSSQGEVRSVPVVYVALQA